MLGLGPIEQGAVVGLAVVSKSARVPCLEEITCPPSNMVSITRYVMYYRSNKPANWSK
jgi:hypothetical protein